MKKVAVASYLIDKDPVQEGNYDSGSPYQFAQTGRPPVEADNWSIIGSVSGKGGVEIVHTDKNKIKLVGLGGSASLHLQQFPYTATYSNVGSVGPAAYPIYEGQFGTGLYNTMSQNVVLMAPSNPGGVNWIIQMPLFNNNCGNCGSPTIYIYEGN